MYTSRALPLLIQSFRYALRFIWRDASNRGEEGKRVLMFVGWQLWKRLIHLPVVVPTDNGFRLVAYPYSDVSAAFVYYCVPDMRDIQFLRSQINGGVLIGANVGSVSLPTGRGW